MRIWRRKKYTQIKKIHVLLFRPIMLIYNMWGIIIIYLILQVVRVLTLLKYAVAKKCKYYQN
jgi:hypothetical protein